MYLHISSFVYSAQFCSLLITKKKKATLFWLSVCQKINTDPDSLLCKLNSMSKEPLWSCKYLSCLVLLLLSVESLILKCATEPEMFTSLEAECLEKRNDCGSAQEVSDICGVGRLHLQLWWKHFPVHSLWSKFLLAIHIQLSTPLTSFLVFTQLTQPLCWP